MSARLRARPPRGVLRAPKSLTDPAEVSVYLQDAARTPGGHAPSVALPTTEAEVAFLLRESSAILPIGAQSSLTGGATPFGEALLSLARMTAIGTIEAGEVRLEAGVALLTLEEELHQRGLFYPPMPTFQGALIGGAAATNAAGAATFKYGSTRDGVVALTVVLASGDVLDVERGACRASPEGCFEIEPASGPPIRIPVPSYRMPRVAKRSAGYYAEPEMDLVDLFVGSEGTLGVVTSLRVRVRPEPRRLFGLVTFRSEAQALELVGLLREASRRTRAAADPRGIDVAAIESMDRRSLGMLREDGKDREHGVRLAPDADTAILFQAELPAEIDAARAMDEIGSMDGASWPDTPLTRLLALLRERGALDDLEVALPGDSQRAGQLLALREAVPMAVNHRIEAVQKTVDPTVHKTAGDMIVPFEHLAEMMGCYRDGFSRRGLDHALWGHVSDGNIHANAIPRNRDDVRLGEEALLEFGEQVARLGGCPLSEHGVGRSRVKQELLRRLYGDAGIAQMRRVKAALDPAWKLAPGVIFPRHG